MQEAKQLFESIANESIVEFKYTLFAKLNVCELLLIELEDNPSSHILSELQLLITQLIQLTNHHHSYSSYVECQLLQAKFSLLESKVDDARSFYRQSISITKEKNLDLLTIKIQQEQENLLEEIDNRYLKRITIKVFRLK